MRILGSFATVVCAVAFALVGCSSSTDSSASERPSCSDTSVSAARLSGGCEQHGKIYKAVVTKCRDHRTMYNIPAAPPHGVSAFSGGKLRTRAISPTELINCRSGP